MVPPSARSAQGGTRRQTTARRHRGLPPAESTRQWAVVPASTQPAPPSAGHCAAVRAARPVRSTGTGCRDGGRSVSDRRPEDPTAAAVPRPVRPGQSAGPQATFHHRALSGKKSFDFFRLATSAALCLIQHHQPLHSIWKVPHRPQPLRHRYANFTDIPRVLR